MRELHLDMGQTGQLPLSRVWEIFKYFKASPPLHLLVRDFVGYKPDASESDPSEPFDVAGLAKTMGDIPTTRTVPAHIRAHIEEMRKANAS
jgi:hypothetical protein